MREEHAVPGMLQLQSICLKNVRKMLIKEKLKNSKLIAMVFGVLPIFMTCYKNIFMVLSSLFYGILENQFQFIVDG